MSSSQIRNKIGQAMSKIRRCLEVDRLQPSEQGIQNLDLIQLKKVLKDNWDNHHRLVKNMNALMQLDISWAALIMDNPSERRQKREFIESNGNYAALWESCSQAIRHNKRLYEATMRLILQRHPDANLPIRLIFEIFDYS
ncbi:Protein CBG10161 [Caenorhabditis briggsae]|uniref:Uncharacterized protein n=2 Tax=Caenorhabditis briggsae TaxID=6238 RepID=A0AAE9JCF6_CAEBR|nr:Protein CBG10161 [Caenorhabditis briggsae]ULU02126.1 hypothetical protein L3Y34_002000 [Caenorhabditis briggsae]UMM24750.1 hypothetical protein L5515_004835 [Caenorhabditis briggsae]CAP29653.1 Protein CBG10161 [Caenorhabditis briggsae]